MPRYNIIFRDGSRETVRADDEREARKRAIHALYLRKGYKGTATMPGVSNIQRKREN